MHQMATEYSKGIFLPILELTVLFFATDWHLMTPAGSESHPHPLQATVEQLSSILLFAEQMRPEENGKRSVTNCHVAPRIRTGAGGGDRGGSFWEDKSIN